MTSDEDMGKLVEAFYDEIRPAVLKAIGDLTQVTFAVAPDDAGPVTIAVTTVAFARYVTAMISAAAENSERDNEMVFWTAVDGASSTFDKAIKEIANHIWPKVKAAIEAKHAKAAMAESADATRR